MITTLLAASLMLSCNPKEILEPTINYPTFVVIDGDTVKTRDDKGLINSVKVKNYGESRLVLGDTVVLYKNNNLPALPSKKADLTKIKNSNDPELKDKPFRMVTVGGSLSAGVRDGGYTNEGMETSFPNLIARQMGIEFNQPLFDASDYNGFGKAVLTKRNITGGPVPKFLEVSNNTAYSKRNSTGAYDLKSLKPGRIDNFSVKEIVFYDGSESKKGFSGYDASFYRLMNGHNEEKFGDLIIKEKFDFIIVCDVANVLNSKGSYQTIYDHCFPKGFEGYTNRITMSYPVEYSSRLNFFLNLKTKKDVKGVVFNTINTLKLPYFKWVSVESVNKEISKYNTKNVLKEAETIVPTGKIDSLLSPLVNMNLKPFINGEKYYGETNYFPLDSDDSYHLQGIIERNKETSSIAKSLGFAVVDIYSIYENIFNGQFVTFDGVTVNISNFFSSDGINPGIFGQMVIANETIKVINQYYKTEIPYISTREFLGK